MAEQKTKTSDTRRRTEEEGGGPISRPAVGDADAHYVDPDLSFEHSVDAGELPPEEKEWHQARDDAREEGLERAEKADEEAIKERRERAKEEAEQRAEERERLAKSGALLPGSTVIPVATETSSKSSGSSEKKSS